MIFLILSIFLYSINNYFWKKILSDSNIWFVIALRSSFTIILGLIWSYFIDPEFLNTITWQQLKFVLIASILGALGLICMVSALKNGSLIQYGIFNLLTIFITVTYLIIFENLNIKYYIIGSSFIIVGFAIYLSQLKKEKVADNSIKQYLLLSLMALFFSFSGLMHWYNLKVSIPVMASLLIQEGTVFVFGITFFLLQPQKVIIEVIRNSTNKIILVVFMSIIIFLAVWFGFMGLKITNPIISSLLSLAVPIITIFFWKSIFKRENKFYYFVFFYINFNWSLPIVFRFKSF